MASKPNVFVAGVGYTPLPSKSAQADKLTAALVSAGTKALLDAGVTYDNVTHSVTAASRSFTSQAAEAFKAFEDGGVVVQEVAAGSELDAAFTLVKERNAQCILVIAVEESAVAAFVVTSGAFLWHYHYLKDSAVLIRESDGSRSGSSKGLREFCQIVWGLRGWSQAADRVGTNNSLSYKDRAGRSIDIIRADGKDVPPWKEVEFKQDGKHRLGYNPVTDTKEISQEDFEAVRASGKSRGKTGTANQFKRKGGDRAALARL